MIATNLLGSFVLLLIVLCQAALPIVALYLIYRGWRELKALRTAVEELRTVLARELPITKP